jgi:transcriptional regulator with GAF, ATPase, and Fis domain
MKPGRTPIGRAAGADGIALSNDPRVSRHHADIVVGPDGVSVVDRSSTGTERNGQRIAGEVELEDGDLLRVGDSFLLFRAETDEDRDERIEGLVGDAPVVRALRRTLALVARSPTTVLLLGPTGTGKEVAARAIHDLSGRSGRFVAVNCSAVPETLAESQLFGHVAGAFTGAKTASTGYFKEAHKGTLFLDEVGDLPVSVQPKMLRVLEDGAVTPVGTTDATQCDVRVIAATNRDVRTAVEAGSFRADLFARLSEFTVELPPLRERREDVLPILAAALGEAPPDLDPELVQELLLHDWPFNVRELLKTASRLKLRGADATRLDLETLGERLRAPAAAGGAPAATAKAPAPAADEADDRQPIPGKEELEALLRAHGGVIADIARVTGRSRKQVYRWLRQHGLDADSYREPR